MADINVGDVAVDVVPDARSFPRKLAAQINPAAKKLGEEIGRQMADSISGGIRRGLGEGFVGSETTSKRKGSKSGEAFGGSFARDAKARIKAALASLPEVQVGVATSRADQELKDLKVRLAALADKTIGVDISDTDALAEMAFLEAELTRLGSQSPNIQVQVDTARATAELAAFRTTLGALDGGGALPNVGKGFGSIASSLLSGVGSLGSLIALVAVLATALVPVIASVTGLAAVLAAPLAAAGGGLTLFGILGGKAIAETLKTSKEIDRLRKNAQTLVDPKAAKAAAQQADALEKSLTGPQRAFLKAKGALSGAFDKLLGGKTGEALFRPIVAGMDLLAKIMPKLSPLIIAVSDALSGLLEGLSKKVGGDGFTRFIEGFARLAGTTLTALGKIAGNVAVALGNIFGAFAPAGRSFLETLTALSAKFAEWSAKASTQRGIQNFIDYIKVNGPVVASTFARIALAVIAFMRNASGIGSAVLRGINTAMGAYIAFLDFIRPVVGAISASISRVGHAFEMVGAVFRGVYNAAIGPVFSFLLRAIGMTMRAWASMLTALGRVPGFGWAKSAGKAMGAAADEALGLAGRVREIPRNVTINASTNFAAAIRQINDMNAKVRAAGGKVHYSTGYGGGQKAYASGTNSAKAGVALVGEEGPEMVRFRGGEQVIPARKTAAMLAASSPVPSKTAGSLDALSPRSIREALDGMSLEVELTGGDRAKAKFVQAGLRAGGRL